MKIFKILFLTSVLGLSASCLKQSESIDPIAPVKTLAEIQRESMMTTALEAAGNNAPTDAASVNVEKSPEPGIFYLNMKYRIDDLDILESANITNSFESLSNSFIRLLANVFIKLKGGSSVDIGNVEIPLPSLNLDFGVIKSIKVKTVKLEYNEDLSGTEDFAFIKTLDIKKITGEKILSYKKTANGCAYKCLDFTVINGDILDLLKSSSLKINPAMTISRLPDSNDFRMDGLIDLQIGLKLPF